MNILITSASRKVALIEAFKTAVLKEGGGKIISVDSSSLSPALLRSDVGLVVPESDNDNFIAALIKICKKYKVKLIVPTRDEELVLFSKNRDMFKNKGIEVMVAKQGTIELCLDKRKFLSFCKKNNLPVPNTYTVGELLQSKVAFPLFVRPRMGKSGKGVFLINNREQLNIFLREAGSFIFQELVKAKEYTIDLFADFKGKIISVVPRERIMVFGGESFIGKTYKNMILINAAIDLAKKLNLIGHNTIQCFYDRKKDTVKFIEVNPRFGGGAALGFKSGAHTPLFLTKLLLGKTVRSQIGKFKENMVMLRYTEDMFVFKGKVVNA